MLVEEGRNLHRLHQLSEHSVILNTIQEAAEFYVQRMLCVPKSHKKYRDASYLLKQSYSFNFSSDEESNPIFDFIKYMRGTVPSNQQTEMEQKFKSALTYATTIAQAHVSLPSKSTSKLLNTSTSLLVAKSNTSSKNKCNNSKMESTTVSKRRCQSNSIFVDDVVTNPSK